MEYYLAIKKNEIIPFALTSMDLESVILSELSQRQISYDTTYMWNLKKNTNGLVYTAETDSHSLQTYLWLPKGKGKGG